MSKKNSLEKKIIKYLKNNKSNVSEISDQFQTEEQETINILNSLSEKGYRVIKEKHKKQTYYYIRTGKGEESIVFISPESRYKKRIRWAEISDIHAGCKQFNPKELETFLKIAKKEGYKHVHISGDSVDGINVYRGQMKNLKHWTLEEQVEELTNILRQYDFDYYAIDGNHDDSWIKRGAPSPNALIAKEINNNGGKFVYLPGYEGDIIIEGVVKRMIHTRGGATYSKSYPGQVYIRNLLDGGLPYIKSNEKKYLIRFLQIGHLHTSIQYETAGIYITHPGAFQQPNDFTISKGLNGPRGGRLTDIDIKNGEVLNYTSKWITINK